MRNFHRRLVCLAIILSLVFCFDLVLSHYNYDPATYLSGYIRRGIEYTLLNGLYLVWLFAKIRQYRSHGELIEADVPYFRHFSNVLKVSSIFLIAAWISYPATSDPFLYLHYGVMSLNGQNPYLIPAKDFISQFSPLLSWSQTSTYGPFSMGLFAVAAANSFVHADVGIYTLKSIFLIVHLINAFLIWNQMKSSSHQTLITTSYLVNPILLFEQVGNARVDVLICTVLILLVRYLKQGNFVGSVIVIWIGILSKTLPIIWLPLLGVFLLWSKRWRSIAVAAFFSIVLLFSLSQTFLPEPKAWISLLNPGVGWQAAGSLHDILNALLSFAAPVLPAFLAEKQAGVTLLFKMLTYALYCFYYLWICVKTYFSKQYTTFNLILDLGWATLVLFLFATPWYQPWYVTILLCFTALLNFDATFFCLTALVYAVCSAVAYYIFSGAPVQFPLFIASLITVIPTIALLCFRTKFIFPTVETIPTQTRS